MLSNKLSSIYNFFSIRKAPGVAALEKAFELMRSVNNDVPPVFDKDFSTRAESSSEATRTIVSPPKKRRNTEDYYCEFTSLCLLFF